MVSLGSTLARQALVVLTTGLLAACSSYGPRTLEKDQIDYSRGVGDSWKNQMLANLVKLRFADMPVFVDVGQIVSGYSLETTVTGSLGFGNTLGGDDSQVLGAGGRYTDRPTITYIPKTGEKFLRSLLEPVEPSAVLSLVLAGYSPDLLFTWAVQSINGLHNFAVNAGGAEVAHPEYVEFVQALSHLQRNGAIGFEIKEQGEQKPELLLRFVDRGASEETLAVKARLLELLDLEPSNQYRVIFSPFSIDPHTLAIQSRSVLQMMLALSRFIDVPVDKQRRAGPGISGASAMQLPFRVHSGPERPDDVFTLTRYHGDWYWIDHEDLASKRIFSLMLFITTLTNYSSDGGAPVLTIPTG